MAVCRISAASGTPTAFYIEARHRQMIEYAFRGVAREAGLGDAVIRPATDVTDRDWEAIAGDFEASAVADLVAEESAVGDDRVRVYPVRTALGRFDHFRADCVIQVVPPLEQIPVEEAGEMPEVIKRHLSRLDVDCKRMASLCWTATPDPEAEDEEGRLRNANEIMGIFYDRCVRQQRLGIEVGQFGNYEC